MNPREIFNAEAKPLHELFITGGGVAGFRIPIYQRTYDWDRENIKRLFEDIASGLSIRSKDQGSLTFLGTLIFVDEKTIEKDFEGKSLSVIDGQQRLTTFTLIATKLYDSLRRELDIIDGKVKSEVYDWLDNEIEVTLRQLQELIYGTIRISGGNIFPFPRIVREYDDTRAKSKIESEFRSVIGKFLDDFSWHVMQEKDYPFEPHIDMTMEGAEVFTKNLEIIDDYVEEIALDTGTDFNLPDLESFKRKGYMDLFKKYPDPTSNKLITEAINHGDQVLGILRLFTFSNYFMECVITTVVDTKEEKYAFEIFDSLNTTGEPLTAIQTFKPQVIKYEKEYFKGYKGSESEQYFRIIEDYLDKYSDPSKKQKESKELVIPFALYQTGEQVSKSLDVQRSYLRANFLNTLEKDPTSTPRKFVSRFSEIVRYREKFWDVKKIKAQIPTYPERDTTLLCLKFLYDMNMTLTIPILCRFYEESIEKDRKELFTGAVKALTGYVVLRRASTGGTKGIDGDLRSIMSDGGRLKNSRPPLCYGIDDSNKLVGLSTFRSYLREWLSKNRIDITDKSSWLKKVTKTGLASSSRHLCRFLILASMHHTRPAKEKTWKLEKTKKSKETDYLNYQTWDSDAYATIEHIAPERPSGDGWKQEIYTEPYLKDSLGNLTVLPQKENSIVANRSWEDKKKIYSAFLAKNDEELQEIIEDARQDGFEFSKRNREILDQGEQLPFFNTIVSVNEWNPEIIKKRTKNIVELAWDQIAPWVFDDSIN